MEFPTSTPNTNPNPAPAQPGAPFGMPGAAPAGGPQPATPPMPAPAAPMAGNIPVTPVSQAVNQSMPNAFGNPSGMNGMGSMNAGPSLGNDEVHSMPEKFLTPDSMAGNPGKAKSKHRTITIVLIVVIVLAVLAIAGGIGFYFWQGVSKDQPTTNVNTTNVTPAVNNANVNTNVNNANVNENVNANENENANANANSNANANVNNANAGTGTTPENNTAAVPSRDTDRDSLTNVEEELYGTQADLPDTDADGFIDGVEIIAGYDPTAAVSSNRLKDNKTNITAFSSRQFGFTVSYPVKWVAASVPEAGNNEVLFTPTNLETAGQFVSVSSQVNPNGLTAKDWYMKEAGVADKDVKTITSFAGVEGVLGEDGNTAYFTSNGYLYTVSLRYGNSAEVHFGTTFQFIAKSIVFSVPATTPAATTTGTNTNDNTNAGLEEDPIPTTN